MKSILLTSFQFHNTVSLTIGTVLNNRSLEFIMPFEYFCYICFICFAAVFVSSFAVKSMSFPKIASISWPPTLLSFSSSFLICSILEQAERELL